MNRFKIHVYFFVVIFISSCASKKNISYFNDSIESNESNKRIDIYSLVFKKNDFLSIIVTGGDDNTLKMINGPISQINSQRSYSSGTPALNGYLIDSDGDIDFPLIGKIKIEGLTRCQTIDLLKEKIAPFIKITTIQIQIQNFKITVLGEVKNAGTYNIPNERISVIEAIGLAGDLTIYGKRKNILVIREEEGVKKKYIIDITNTDFMNSPVYFLNQNDVIYVEPNQSKINSSSVSPSAGIFIAVASLIITTINLISK